MPKKEDIKVRVNLHNDLAEPGGFLSGTVNATTTKDELIHGVSIQLFGSEKLKQINDKLSEEKTLIKDAQNLFGNDFHFQSENGLDDAVVLPEGVSSFPFVFQIPRNVPPSIIATCGRKVLIDYKVKARVNIPWSHSPTCEKSFRVGGQFEKGSVHDAEEALEYRIAKCFSFKTSTVIHLEHHLLELTATLITPVTWRGGQLGLHVKTENNSGRTVYGIRAKIKQYIRMAPNATTQKYLLHRQKFAPRPHFPLRSGCKWSGNLWLDVPSNQMIVPTVRGSSLLKVDYILTLSTRMSYFASDLKLRLPLPVVSHRQMQPSAKKVSPQTDEFSIEVCDSNEFTKQVIIAANPLPRAGYENNKAASTEDHPLIQLDF